MGLFLKLTIFLGALDVLATPTDVIKTTSGPIRGKVEDGIRQFLSIPYAKPPVGELRFKDPEEPSPWTHVKECTHQAEPCPQIHPVEFFMIGNEDCLYMDIHTPKKKNSTELLPVFFWLYGGGWIFGDQYEFGAYNVKHLVEKHDIIVVSVNYRLGPFGFLALDELVEESAIKSTGNAALLDQLIALKWLNRNIRAFGGDPDRITIAGESAGAFSVCWHMASPLSAGLFHGGIMESGTCDRHEFFRDFSNAKSFSKVWARAHGCNHEEGSELLACLRKKKTGQLMEWKDIHDWGDEFRPEFYPFMPWAAVIDGTALPDLPLSLIQKGKFNRVPLLIGTNHDEGTIFEIAAPLVVPGFYFPINAKRFEVLLNHFSHNNQTINEMVKKEYAITDNFRSSQYVKITAVMLRDGFFISGTRRIASAISQFGESVWMYQFNFDKGWFYNLPLGDFHASELLMLWDNYKIIHPSRADEQMSKTFHLYWTNMVKYGSPNTPSGVIPPEKPDIVIDWPSWDASSKKNMALTIPPRIDDYLEDAHCDFWDTLPV